MTASYWLKLEIYDIVSYIGEMKVTALLPDTLVNEVKKRSKGKNITESLLIALNEWLAIKRIKYLNASIRKLPLSFEKGFSGQKTRELNRRR